MAKERIAFAGFEGRDTQLIKLSRAGCALYLANKGHVPLSIRTGNDGRHYNEFIVHPGGVFQELLSPFYEILITVRPEEEEPQYVIDAYYVGHPYYKA
ncbi:hypothetical protein H0178_20730 [Cytobacillus firmus]|uniref:hypothetical protein n=1 Tax=Paenibacillus lautus TaxID=1401 RepID=UPI00384EB1CC|nr:hypothetical protein [Cytobacillus firmus]